MSNLDSTSTGDTPGTTQRSPGVALFLDVIAVLLFALLARIAHNTPEMPLSFGGWLDTSWPFLIGVVIAWALLWIGVVRPDGANGTGFGGFEFSTGALVWVVNVVVGLGIWGVRHGEVPHWSFMIVATVMSGLLLFGWRGMFRLGRLRRLSRMKRMGRMFGK
ncbi:DUF3054 domain-containing protein [Corynebacterium jeikeium]|uniref:DUF3054 domain-containing protein n=1 Tax=Corynebacterium jeikeium TaxID=38289 RepID=UPI0001B71862|nr:DUF3054 domain-containing protein [Corynebacterium jeikeium]EEW16573.1 hypothetical protein HMPREF0297_1080 [Corynebacterium jeikeium ATCC 43734]OOD29875.1 hypothetical protein BWP03_08725 [Corynebacterium jeikeium]WCZ52694.1 hypothetical protein CJEIK_00745 [Corynebacterium jeikeium]SUY82000.1 putative integral membrane protein [Corynebacterium jeikeium]